jgi:PKD repeat protein
MPYTPNFMASQTSVARARPTLFTYTGDTTPSIAGYFWSFSDGLTSNNEQPEVEYKTIGLKTVTLTVVFNDGVQSSVTKVNYVTVTEDTRTSYIELLPPFFRANVSWSNFLTPFLDQTSLLEGQVEKLKKQRSFYSIGNDLDVVGEVLGLPRLGKSDGAYASALQAMPEINHGSGQLEILIAYTNLFLSPTNLLVFPGPMHLTFDAVVNTSQNFTLFLQRLRSRAAAGTTVELLISDETPLEFEGPDEPALFSGSELSEIDDYYNGGILPENV